VPDSKTLVIACGGTGGHLFPGIAVAEAWEASGGKALLLISEKKVDAQASSKYGGLSFETIPAVAKPPTLSLKMLPFLIRLWKTDRQCRQILKKHNALSVIGMGGFTSLPPVHAGHAIGLPTFVHDSNALPGKANRMTARWCHSVLLGLEAAVKFFPKSTCKVTGTPVRRELNSLPSRKDAAQKWGLDPAKKTVLVMGGSQGAKHLNTLMADSASKLSGVQFLHLTGAADAERVKGMVGDNPEYRVVDFCDDMSSAFAVSDISVCRSGASSLTELSHVGMPALLVPYPYAADDHQTKNADVFSASGACLLKQEVDLSTDNLVENIKSMLQDGVFADMQKKMQAMAVPDAAQQIVTVVKEAINAR